MPRSFTVILNGKSGSQQGDDMRHAVAAALAQAGLQADIVDIATSDQTQDTVRHAVARAGRQGHVVVAAGGGRYAQCRGGGLP